MKDCYSCRYFKRTLDAKYVIDEQIVCGICEKKWVELDEYTMSLQPIQECHKEIPVIWGYGENKIEL